MRRVHTIRVIASPAIALVSLGAALLVACAEDLPQATEIEDARVLGARAEVEGDPERATPAPGDKVDVHYEVVFPDLDRDVSSLNSLLINCTFPTRYTGIPLCKEVADLAQQGVSIDDVAPQLERLSCTEDDRQRIGTLGLTCVSGEPRVSIGVPAGFRDKALLVRGVICERGVPFADASKPELFGCEPDDPDDPGQTMLVHGSIPVELEPAQRNHNPSFDDFEVQLAGRAWPAFAGDVLPPMDDCAEQAGSAELPLIDPFEHRLGVAVDAAVREEVDGVPEDLEFSFFVTEGELDTRFVIFEGADEVDGELSGHVQWKGPGRKDLSPRGQLARVFVSVLDRRGGFDLAERYACLYDCLDGEVDAPVGCQ